MMSTEPNFKLPHKEFENGFREHVKLIEVKRIPEKYF